MDNHEVKVSLESVLSVFLAAHPSYRAMVRVSPDGDVQIQPELYRAMTWWLRRTGRISQQQAMKMETFNRRIEHGEEPWRQ